MNKYIDADRLRAEIKRLKQENTISDDKEYAQYELDVACGYDMALEKVLLILNSLQQEQHVDGLDEEIERVCTEIEEKNPQHRGLNPSGIAKIARHFAELGKKNTLDRVVEWMKKNLVFTHPRKGDEACIVNIGAFLDAMNDDE